MLLSIVFIFQILRGTLDFVLIRFSSDSMARLVRDAFARVQRFSSDWHANTFAGATVRRLTRGMWAFDTFTDTMIFNFMPAMVVVAAISAVFLLPLAAARLADHSRNLRLSRREHRSLSRLGGAGD